MPALSERVESLRRERDAAARELGLDPSLLVSRTLMEEIVIDPAVVEEKLLPWQRGLLSDGLSKLGAPRLSGAAG